MALVLRQALVVDVQSTFRQRVESVHDFSLEREFFSDDQLVRIHLITGTILVDRPGLAPWEFEFPFSEITSR